MANPRLELLLLLSLGLTTLHGVNSQDPSPPVYRLPSTVSPRLYTIRLEPDLDTGVVTGTVSIEVNTTSDVTQTLNSITLHLGTEVTVNEMTGIIMDMDGIVQTIGAFNYDDANKMLTLELPAGKTLGYNHIYVIRLEFQSGLNTESKGLFMGYFNSTSKYVASNFRPTHARDVFPCFDEPQFKVPVTLQVLRPVTHYTLSTAPLASSSAVTSDNKVLDTFSNTDPISIHSLGLFMSSQPAVTSMGVSLVVPPTLPTSVSYLDKLISAIVDMVGPFPLSPLTLIVLPDRAHTSFSSYGFVFTSPKVYLGEVGSPLQWTRLQLQLTEEFLRQYFEYTKTPQWWSDLWLSESLGTYFSLHVQQDEPWLKDWLNIVIRSEALGDYTSATAPVITGGDLSEWDIENIINNQTIKIKGLSTLLMWSKTLPGGLVVKTIHDFLQLPKSVVSTDDFLKLMEANIYANTTYDVTPAIPLLPNWLTEPGSPLVWFEQSDTTFNLIQGTPCSSGGPTPALRSLSVALAEGSDADWSNFRQGRWLLNASTQYSFDDPSQAQQGSVINTETAPFRVNYQNSQWWTLIRDIAAGWAPVTVVSALQDDAVALALQGCLDFSTALSVLNSSQHSSLDWWPVVKATDTITSVIGSDWYGYTAFGLYFADLFTSDLLDQLDVRSSSSYANLTVARELVTPWLCRFNIHSCREAVVEMGAPLWQGNASGIAGSDLENVACYGARYTPGALQPLLAAYQSADDVWLRRLFTIALSCLTEQSSVNGLLDVIMKSTSSSTQRTRRSSDSEVTLDLGDARQILIGLSSDLENSKPVIDLILSQPTDIQTKLGASTFSSVIKNLAKNRAELSQLSSLQDESLDLDPYVVQSVSQAVAASDFKQAWYSAYSTQLYSVLPQGQSTTTSSTTSTTTTSTSTTTTTTTSTPRPSPGPTSSTTTPAPGGSPALSDFRVFTLALTALLIVLDVYI